MKITARDVIYGNTNIYYVSLPCFQVLVFIHNIFLYYSLISLGTAALALGILFIYFKINTNLLKHLESLAWNHLPNTWNHWLYLN